MASKLDVARQYVLDNYNNGADFRWDELSRKLQIRSIGDEENPTPNTIHHTQDKEPPLWLDCDTRKINSIACDCATETGVNVTDREIRIVLNSEDIPSVNPLRDYLNHLDPYNPDDHDGQSWIDWLAGQVHVADDGKDVEEDSRDNQEYWTYCFKKWFVAMVASWLYDEVVNQEVLVLIGRQGIYKTTWLERLLPPCLSAYGTKMSNPHDLNKDERMRVTEYGLIFMDELDAYQKRELNAAKSLITTTDVNERAAYAYTKERRVRIASFCGSGNEPKILTDDTGNRRWLMFNVESIENPYNWNRSIFPYDQIYGEAIFLVQNGFPYWFDTDEIKDIEQHNKQFVVMENEEDLLSIYFAPAMPGDPNALFLTTSEISQRLRDYGSLVKPMGVVQLGKILKKHGFSPRKSNGRQGYVVYVKQDIDNQRKLDARSATDL